MIADAGQIVASGAIRFADWLPRPDNKRRGMVYVHSVYTAPAYRRKGLARRILDEHRRSQAPLRLVEVDELRQKKA